MSTAMHEISQGVYEIPIARIFVNAFVVAGDSVTLVDAALPGRQAQLLGAVTEAGRDPAEVRDIAITHHHVDHTGSLASLVRTTGARVHAHRLEAPILRGEQAPPPLVGASLGSRVFLAVLQRLGPSAAAPAPVDHEVADEEELAGTGLRVVYTPGHTMGHVSFLHAASGTLFVGDAAASGRKGLTRAVGNHDEDPDAAAASIARLAALDFETACFGHGRTVSLGAKRAFSQLAERVAEGR
jgi:glyoxylase-like metal-dependent hydrolase (beta-lactamase superfamily II)